MDAVVVDTESTAKDCILYLKEKKAAPETFIPLDTIRAKPVRDALRMLGGTKIPVQDVVSAPEHFAKAVQYAVGDAIVCDGLDEARQLAYHSTGPAEQRFKVVTLDGCARQTAVATRPSPCLRLLPPSRDEPTLSCEPRAT